MLNEKIMNKTSLVIGREYLSRVRKKSFLLTTLLVPLIIIGFYAAIIAITIKGGGKEDQKIAVIDEAGIFSDSLLQQQKGINFIPVKNETEQSFTPKYKQEGYNAFLYIPSFNIDSNGRFVLHSTSSMSLSATGRIERIINQAIEDKRLAAQGIDVQRYKSIEADVSIENTIDSKEGGKRSVAGVAYAVSFACGILIYMMMIIYGTQVMRGVTEEKTNRIAEVVISSVKPFQLMMGKIIGIGAVGLTQFAIWGILLFFMQMALPIFFPDLLTQVQAGAPAGSEANMAATVMQGFSSLPLLKIGLSFIFYFLAGYLTYASLFAAVGSVVSEDQQDAQQMVFPILMPIILGFVIMTQAINDPNSTLAVFFSIFPLTSPIVMMGRITYDIPMWQLALSVVCLIACFLLLTWLTAKIYRTGILMYGKKPTWKEMFKWAIR